MPIKTLKASESYAFLGCNWTAGEARTLEVAEGVELPDWLSEAKPSKAKPGKAKKAEAKPDAEG